MAQVRQIFTGNTLRNFNYIIVGDGGDLFVIDPYDAGQLSPLIAREEGRPVGVINTHEHADHTRGNEGLVKRFGFKVYAHKNARGAISSIDHPLEGGEEIVIDETHRLAVMDTPGHTAAHLCLLLLKNGEPEAVFTGDTLFNAGVGNCYNGGDPETLYGTIKKWFTALPDSVRVYPGHEYLGNNLGFTLKYWPSNRAAENLLKDYQAVNRDKVFFVADMGKEREINSFLQTDRKEIVDRLNMAGRDEKQVFLRLRELRDQW